MEVIAFIDDCGHQIIVDVSTVKQSLKIHTQMLQEVLDEDMVMAPYGKDEEKERLTNLARCLVGSGNTLLGTGASEEMMGNATENIQEFLGGIDICLGAREGIDPIGVCTDWPRGCMGG